MQISNLRTDQRNIPVRQKQTKNCKLDTEFRLLFKTDGQIARRRIRTLQIYMLGFCKDYKGFRTHTGHMLKQCLICILWLLVGEWGLFLPTSTRDHLPWWRARQTFPQNGLATNSSELSLFANREEQASDGGPNLLCDYMTCGSSRTDCKT